MSYTVEQTEKFIELTNEAGKRTRYLTYLIGVFTIFSFVILIDSSKYGWVRARHEKLSQLEAAYENFPYDNMQSKAANWENFRNQLSEDDASIIGERSFINNGEQLKKYKALHDDLLEDALTVEAPILGLSFDINNFPLFYGLSFVLLMAILWVGLRQEKSFLTHTIKTIENEGETGNNFDYRYYYLAMGQVLTNPKMENGTENPKFDLRYFLQIAIYLLPAIMMFSIVTYAILSFSRRSSINLGLATTYVLFEFALFILIVLLSYFCIKEMKDINKKWKDLR